MRAYVCVALAGAAIAFSVAGCGLEKAGLQAIATTGEDGGQTTLPPPTLDDAGSGVGGGDGNGDSGSTAPTDAGVARDAGAVLDTGVAPESDSAPPDEPDARVPPPPPNDAAPTDPCVDAVPSGWSVVAYEQAQDACPASLGNAHDEYTGATSAAGACTCECQVTTPPTCTMGTVATAYGTTGTTCPTPGESFTVNGSTCTALPAAGGLVLNFQASPVPLSGGACSGTAQSNTGDVTKDGVRYCDVPAASAEAVCEGTAPAGFAACIVSAGDVPCPNGSPFTTKTSVADDEVLACSACTTCAVGGTCTNPLVTFYSDAMCATQVAQLVADNVCAASNAATKPVVSVEYTAQTNATCLASGSTASFTPQGPRTLCCR
jgi:hypothetical protein